jgi:hypothetical protein
LSNFRLQGEQSGNGLIDIFDKFLVTDCNWSLRMLVRIPSMVEKLFHVVSKGGQTAILVCWSAGPLLSGPADWKK